MFQETKNDLKACSIHGASWHSFPQVCWSVNVQVTAVLLGITASINVNVSELEDTEKDQTQHKNLKP